jgi:acyl dehydratase
LNLPGRDYPICRSMQTENRMSIPTEYRVQARNLSHASENKIHDDDVARRFGFQGGLVPGVEIYAYMTHLPAARWGVEWLERGTAECRFFKPVYDGRIATVTATEEAAALSLTVTSEGQRCATGTAALPSGRNPAPTAPDAAPIPAFQDRPDADEASLAVGRRMSCQPLHMTPERLQQYRFDIGETEPLYARENLVHPALMLRLSNSALKENVKLGPWIHAGSSIRHCALAHAGESLAAHATVAANYERNGHRLVDLDVVIVADGVRAVAQVRHTAIYRLRQGS